MKCPHCNLDLQPRNDRGIEAHACPKCNGIWFSPSELDQFEDLAIDPQAKTGSLFLVTRATQLHCPVCSAALKQFDYRFCNLQLDYCPDHGFWLEADEDARVLAVMREQAAAADRKYTAEDKWGKHLNYMRSPTFFAKLKNLFKS